MLMEETAQMHLIDADPCYCCAVFHVSPHETLNPDEYVTEVCYPIKKA